MEKEGDFKQALKWLEEGKAVTIGKRGWYIKLDENNPCPYELIYYYSVYTSFSKDYNKKINRSITTEEIENAHWRIYDKRREEGKVESDIKRFKLLDN